MNLICRGANFMVLYIRGDDLIHFGAILQYILKENPTSVGIHYISGNLGDA
jgi:hypothetical protein